MVCFTCCFNLIFNTYFQTCIDYYPQHSLTRQAIFSILTAILIKDFVKTMPKQSEYISFAMSIMGDFGITIAVPAVIGTFLGVWLDKKFHSTPWLLILCLLLAFVFTAIIINRKAKKYGKEFDDLNR